MTASPTQPAAPPDPDEKPAPAATADPPRRHRALRLALAPVIALAFAGAALLAGHAILNLLLARDLTPSGTAVIEASRAAVLSLPHWAQQFGNALASHRYADLGLPLSALLTTVAFAYFLARTLVHACRRRYLAATATTAATAAFTAAVFWLNP